MRLLWLAKALRAEGLDVIEVRGWETRGRDTMNPQGIVAHHTATGTNWTDSAVVKLLRDGRSDLPGPLAQLGLDRLGRYHVIASGRANHAGKGSWRGVVGNSSMIGIEAFNSGKGEPWPQVQLDAYAAGSAAILRRIKRDESWFCGHREWAPGRKPDPFGIDLDAMRSQIAGYLERRPTESLTPDEVEKLRDLIWAWESIGSNPSFPIYTIDHTRKGR